MRPPRYGRCLNHTTKTAQAERKICPNYADARSGIVNDPNREYDPEYIVRLVGQVVTVSVETVRLVGELAGLGIDQV